VDSSFGPLDAFAFLVFAVLIFVGVVIIVSLGKLPGQLARKWSHPQAAAINAMSWIGIATGGLLWPIAFIWAFTTPHHGIEKRAPANARRCFKRKNGWFWRAQFCTEVARPERFERPTPRFVVCCS
jgi:Protein of unknown function (DUF3302)